MIFVSKIRNGVDLACLVALSAMLSGCVTRELISLDNGYEKTRLPVHLDRAEYKDEKHFSFSLNGRQTNRFDFKDQDSVPISVGNNAYTADASLLFEAGDFHYGLQLGLSPVDQGLLRLGGYWGFQVEATPHLIASLTGGVFMNNNANRTKYTHYESALLISTPEEEDSVNGNIARLEIPLRANLMYRTDSKVSPYVSYSANRIAIGARKAGAILLGQELATGFIVELPQGNRIRIEGNASYDGIIGREAVEGTRNSGTLWGMHGTFVRRF